jgi:hypothetical protein
MEHPFGGLQTCDLYLWATESADDEGQSDPVMVAVPLVTAKGKVNFRWR